MSAATLSQNGIDLQSIAQALAPGKIRFDPLGMISGYKAYLIYTGLAAKSDQELEKLGLTRAELPKTAMLAASSLRN